MSLLQHPLVLGACSLMLFIEFFADKIPGLDTLWDLVHTVIRIPAGAALAAAVFGVDDAVVTLVAALLGGTLAATAHTAKATTRAAVNTSPEPFSNLGVSLLEDGLVPLALWFAYEYPFAFLAALAVALVLMLLLITALSKFLVGLWRRLRGGRPVPVPEAKVDQRCKKILHCRPRRQPERSAGCDANAKVAWLTRSVRRRLRRGAIPCSRRSS